MPGKGFTAIDVDSDRGTSGGKNKNGMSWCYIANSILTLGISVASIALLYVYHKQDSDHINTLTSRVTIQEDLISALQANLTALTS